MQLADDRGVRVMIVTWNVFVFPILNNQTSHGVNIRQGNERTVSTRILGRRTAPFSPFPYS